VIAAVPLTPTTAAGRPGFTPHRSPPPRARGRTMPARRGGHRALRRDQGRSGRTSTWPPRDPAGRLRL